MQEGDARRTRGWGLGRGSACDSMPATRVRRYRMRDRRSWSRTEASACSACIALLHLRWILFCAAAPQSRDAPLYRQVAGNSSHAAVISKVSSTDAYRYACCCNERWQWAGRPGETASRRRVQKCLGVAADAQRAGSDRGIVCHFADLATRTFRIVGRRTLQPTLAKASRRPSATSQLGEGHRARVADGVLHRNPAIATHTGIAKDAIPVSNHPMEMAGSSPAMTWLRAVRQQLGPLVLLDHWAGSTCTQLLL